jgi:hypothetical protein
MQCKICERERQVRKYFKTAPKKQICDECLEDMGYGHQISGQVYSDVKADMMKRLDKKISATVNQELPKLIEKLMIESDLTFELKVA